MSETHIAILPSSGMGHLIPLVELAKRLASSHSISITFFNLTTNASPSQLSLLQNLYNSNPRYINIINLPPQPMDDLSSDTRPETRISLIMKRSLPSLRKSLAVLISTTPISALVVDLFGTDAFDVACELHLPVYIFFGSTAAVLSFLLYLPTLDTEISGEYRDLENPIEIPGCFPIAGKDMLDPVQDRKDQAYSWVLHLASRHREANGILLNTWEDLEPKSIKALRNGEPLKQAGIPVPAIFPVGPLTAEEGMGVVSSGDCLRWLDEQPLSSVLFVSFGSGGTLPDEQFVELAWGLEMSEHRFLWVARSPSGIASSNFFNSESLKNPLEFLPDGFLERNKKLGFIVPSWAPQIEVLKHCSTGGFLSHCGWNSILESVVNGVPLIAWPLYAEQRMNALMLVGELKIAMRPQMGENGVVGRVEIARVVKSLMEGEEGNSVRNRVREVRDGGVRALEEAGSSYRALSEVAHEWKTKNGI